MTAPAPVTDPRHCPLCGQANGCAMEAARVTGQEQPPCWCMQVDFQRAVLLQIPSAARGLACICRACATAGTAAA
ncbi:cysteine-rich CWC family protein [uncultured Ramlibacter sp.]|uniref:cysteine-rich CWC family protein n=1 Tax=uncultured Ramlibacter sp. TaxID=260755 RepID=UPI002614675A|nr:cysteine-rich CWC family protein [uncultured Ramlibacter sp.]